MKIYIPSQPEINTVFRWVCAVSCLISALSVALCVGYHLTLEHYIGMMQSSQSTPESADPSASEDIFENILQPTVDENGTPVLSGTSSVLHVLLIGTDARTPGEQCRSDAMILLSVNRQSKKIVACSLLRDMLVSIDGYSENKLNSAYSYGGADLLLRTLRENLNLEIQNYVSVDFSAFIRIVDLLGGVTVTVSADEAKAMNEICRQMGAGVSQIPLKSGTYYLNGEQALAFSRDRSSAMGDFDRTARQRTILQALLDRLKGTSVFALLSLVDEILPYVSTNLSVSEWKNIISCLPDWMNYSLVSFSVPCDGSFSFDAVRGMSVIRVDFKKNISYLYEQIYS